MVAEYGPDGKRISKRKPVVRKRQNYTPDNPKGKLTDDQVREIRRMYSIDKLSMATIAMQMGVSISCINNIINRRHRREVSDEV